jgi:hypothetical protein
MVKLEAESLAHLVRMADQLGVEPIGKRQRDASGRRIAPVQGTLITKQPMPHSVV